MSDTSRLTQLVLGLAVDPSREAEFRADPHKMMQEAGLSPEEQEVLISGDYHRIRGAVNVDRLPSNRAEATAEIAFKAWKDPHFRSELQTNAKAAIERVFGVRLPERLQLVVHEETQEVRHIVLPWLPPDWQRALMVDDKAVRRFAESDGGRGPLTESPPGVQPIQAQEPVTTTVFDVTTVTDAVATEIVIVDAIFATPT